MTVKKTRPDTVEVAILGSTYTLRGGSDPTAIKALAAELDARMRELAETVPAADPLKVSVLTALRLADEARDLRERASSREEEIAERIDACAARIDRMLAWIPDAGV